MSFSLDKLTFLDGALGSELQRRGFATTLPLWSARALFDQPELVKEIHKDYIKAGANIITTNTFRTQQRTLAKVGLEKETERINELAVQLVQEAREECENEGSALQKVWVAASVVPLEECYRTDLVPDSQTLLKEHREQCALLAQSSPDLFLIETINTLREAYAACQAAHEQKIPFLISFVINSDGNLLSGESLQEAVGQIDELKPSGYLVNCVAPEIATIGLRLLKEATGLPIGAYAQGEGHTSKTVGWDFSETHTKEEEYLEWCKKWKDLGATVIGGCCGTTPAHTKLYSQL